MLIRIIGVISVLIGLMLLLSGLSSIFQTFPNSAYSIGYKLGTLAVMLVGLFLLIYGARWVMRGKRGSGSNDS